MGQNVKDNELVKEAIEQITNVGFERWSKGETETDSEKAKPR